MQAGSQLSGKQICRLNLRDSGEPQAEHEPTQCLCGKLGQQASRATLISVASKLKELILLFYSPVEVIFLVLCPVQGSLVGKKGTYQIRSSQWPWI